MHKRKRSVCDSWRMDETYIKVGGKYRYLYRAVDKYGYTVDFLLTKRRMKGSAQKFLEKVIENNGRTRVINIDKSGANSAAIRTVNARSFNRIRDRSCKYLNNMVEQDYRNVKRKICISTGFEEFESAQRTLAEMEAMSIIWKGQMTTSKPTHF